MSAAPPISPREASAVLLAAGRSERFGADKLLAPLAGRPLLAHAAAALAAAGLGRRIAVVAAGADDRAAALSDLGFAIVFNPKPEAGQGASLALGAERARQDRPRALLVALADMPFVTPGHIQALLTALDPDDPRAAAASWAEGTPRPPVAFGAGWLDELCGLSGDRGARALLADAANVAALAAPSETLADIDAPADLLAAEARQEIAR